MFNFIIFLLSFFSVTISIMGLVISAIIGTNWIVHLIYFLLSGYILYWSVK